jgi:hypothetical protein
MIARNPKNHADQWLVAAAYFADNFEALTASTGEQEPPPAAGWNEALRELEAVAEKQKAYFKAKQNEFPCIEDYTGFRGEVSLPDNITPLLKQAEANGRYSEADWWLSTIREALRREAPAPEGVVATPSVSGNSDREQQRNTTGVTAGETATPSSPTAERREIVARIEPAKLTEWADDFEAAAYEVTRGIKSTVLMTRAQEIRAMLAAASDGDKRQ